ncbi:DUF1570 domain-containing protein [Pseudoalteromonas sp. TB64]|uniref:DUF1570 domain-containing protein n=1 Tax=Pseudoalteromonas sp. TB64 TaxID=1938600 RepID=UPI0004045835|nr:DUF1570 domain-containing protein [Pseudoalteromonas sp. TB64]
MLKTKLRVLFVFFVLLIASLFIVNHFTGRVFNYHDPIGELKLIYNNLTSQPVTEPLITKPPFNIGTVALQNTPKHGYNHLSQTDNTKCVDVSLGEVKYKRNGDIYTWTDNEGIPHFSDKKPDFAVTTYDTRFAEPLDYFDLTLNTPNLPSSFNQELRIKLNTVFKVYGQIIGVHALKKVKLNLTVLATRHSYEARIKQHGGDPTNSIGMYFNSSNSAFIDYRNVQSAMRTSVHEAVHAINRAVLGNTPRWLNEGLAEYFEDTKNNMQTGIVEPNSSWVKNNSITKNVYSLNKLLNSENIWRKGDSSKLYRSSWAVIYFLMDTKNGKALLKSIMLEEQKSPCSKLADGVFKKMVYEQYPRINSHYSQWLSAPLKTHNF